MTKNVVEFYGDQLEFVEKDGVTWVALKPICAGIGVNWNGQLEKLKEDDSFNYADICMVGADGRNREMVCLPLDQIHGWICSINHNRVKEECREKLLLYKRECYQVLFRYSRPGALGEIHPMFNQLEERFESRFQEIEDRQDRDRKDAWDAIDKLRAETDRMVAERRALRPFLSASASSAGAILESHKRTKNFRN